MKIPGGKNLLSFERVRFGVLLVLAVVPFVLVVAMAYFWVFRPLNDEVRLLSRDIETRFEGVARLQLALVRSAMPVNDYLIHGNEAEKREFQRLAGRVEAAFSVLRGSIEGQHVREIEHVDSLYARWRRASVEGEAILAVDPQARHRPEAAVAMETFDATLDGLVDEAEQLLEHVREELSRSRDELNLRRERLTWFVALSTLIATLVLLVSVLALSQRLTRRDD